MCVGLRSDQVIGGSAESESKFPLGYGAFKKKKKKRYKHCGGWSRLNTSGSDPVLDIGYLKYVFAETLLQPSKRPPKRSYYLTYL